MRKITLLFILLATKLFAQTTSYFNFPVSLSGINPQYESYYTNSFDTTKKSIRIKGTFDTTQNIFIPADSSRVSHFVDGFATIYKNGKYGIIDVHGNLLRSIEQDIQFYPGIKIGILEVQKAAPYDARYEMMNSLPPPRFGGTYFICDANGNILVPELLFHPSITPYSPFPEPLWPVKKNGCILFTTYIHFDQNNLIESGKINSFMGAIDPNGKLIVPLNHYFAMSNFSDNRALVYLPDESKTKSKAGYIDHSGKEVIPCIYNDGFPFINGVAKVGISFNPYNCRESGQYGYIDTTGKIVIPLVYRFDELSDFASDLKKYENDKKKWAIESATPPANSNYQIAHPFSNGLAMVGKNNLWGFINKNGKEIIPCQYENCGFFSNGLAKVCKNGKWGFINTKGQEIIPLKYYKAGDFNEGMACVYGSGRNGQGYGTIDTTGQEVIPFLYSNNLEIKDGLIKVCSYNKWGWIDKTGKSVIACDYEKAGDFNNGIAIVWSRTWWRGWIDTAGHSHFYTYIKDFHDGMAVVCENKKSGFIDSTGKEIIPCTYDLAGDFGEGLAPVCINKKWGYINKKNQLVIPCAYDQANSFSNGCAVIKIDNKMGMIDKSGKVILPCNYDLIADFFTGFAMAWKDSKWGFIDSKGYEIAPCIYESVQNFSEGYACVRLNGEWFYIDEKGQRVK